MSLIPVIPVSDAIAAMDRGETICFIQQKVTKKGKDGKPEPPKSYNGCLFFEVHFKVNVVGADGKITTKECKGDFSYNELTTTKVPLDPSTPEAKNTDGKTKPPVIQTNVSKAGELGQFLLRLKPQLEKAIKAAGEGGIQFFETENLKIRSIVKTHVSKKAKENAGGLIYDPIIYIRSPPGKYPATYPTRALQNQRKSVFVDFASRRVVAARNGKAKQEFDFAVIRDENGEPILDDNGEQQIVNEDNLYQYLKYGSVINQGRMNCGTISISNVAVSTQINATWSAVTPAVGNSEEAEFEGDYVNEELTEVMVKETELPNLKLVQKQVAQPETVSAAVANSTDPAEAQVVDDLLNDL